MGYENRELGRSGLPAAAERIAKGKDFTLFDRTLVGPNEKPWHALDREQVRYRATTVPAVLLSKGERQAAGRDPGLEWDETKRTYRPRRKATPAPPLANVGDAGGWGASKVSDSPASRPARANDVIEVTDFCSEKSDV